MTADQLRAAQAPLKERYKAEPGTALITLRAHGTLTNDLGCDVPTWPGVTRAGLHPATGGDGTLACSGDMLLQALAGCAGVTLNVVATAMGIALRSAHIDAEGDLDFRGTLGVSRDAPVGFAAIRLLVSLETDADADKVAKLIELTERYCVVAQTLKAACPVTVARR
jgi:uncharacterized OsmC-like protein